MKKVVFSSQRNADGDGKMKDTLGRQRRRARRKCAGQAPVPPGFTISRGLQTSTSTHNNAVPAEIDAANARSAPRFSEERMGQKLGDIENPRLVSVRSGAKFLHAWHDGHHPHLGSTTRPSRRWKPGATIRGFAYDCYRRLSRCTARSCWRYPRPISTRCSTQKKKAKAHLDTELTAEDLKQVIVGYKKLVEKKPAKPFPQDALAQLQERATPCSLLVQPPAPSTTAR